MIVSTFMFYNAPYALAAGSIAVNGSTVNPPTSATYTVPVSASGSTLVIGFVDSVTVQPTVTCGGVIMNSESAVVNTHSSNNAAFVYSLNCPTGSQVFANTSGNLYLLSYTGVNSVTPIEASSTKSKVTNPACSFTTTHANDWIIGAMNGANVVSAGTGNTLRDSNGGPSFGDSNGGLAAGSNSITFNIAAGAVGGGFCLVIQPVSVAATNLNFLHVF